MTENKDYTLITGASSGIGKALAQKCASLDLNLILVALPDTGLEEFAKMIRLEFGVEVHTQALNLTHPDAPVILYNACQQNDWKVNMLINNVGMGNVGAFENDDYIAIQYMMTLNMAVMVQLTRLFLPQIKKSGQGYILNVSSIAGLFPLPFKTIYSATKSFVYSFSRSMYFELEHDKVQVSCLCPGPVATNGQVVETNRQLGWKARYFTMNAQKVAEVAMDNMLKGKFLIIPGWENKLLTFVGKIIPEFILLRLMARTFKKRTFTAEEEAREKEFIYNSAPKPSLAAKLRTSRPEARPASAQSVSPYRSKE
jgi:uncharacterized protein